MVEQLAVKRLDNTIAVVEVTELATLEMETKKSRDNADRVNTQCSVR